MKDYLTHLSVQYQGIAPVYEEYESYFKVIDLFKKVSHVFYFFKFYDCNRFNGIYGFIDVL